MQPSIKKICEMIWQLEERYHLLDMDIDGVKAWQAQRMTLYSQIAVRSELFSQVHAPTSGTEKLKGLFGFGKNALLHGSLALKPRDVLIVSHPRTKLVDGQNIDIYTHYLEQELIQKGISFYELDRSHHGLHLKAATDFRVPVDDMVLLRKALSPLIAISGEQHTLLRELESKVQDALKINIDIDTMLHRYAQRFRVEQALYARVLDRVQPKEIRIVVSYSDMQPLVAAAKKRSIVVKELQHGNFSQYHLGYSFPGRSAQLDYFPDHFLAWNSFWKNAIDWPIDDDNVGIEPFRYLQQQRQKYAQLHSDDKQLVVISQGALGEQIAAKILKNFSRFADYQIKYKLHPGEFANWKSYPSLLKLADKSNVEILFDTDLYKLFSQSAWQLGVYSTALYEGVEFGCKTILLDLPGLQEHMRPFIKHYDAEILS